LGQGGEPCLIIAQNIPLYNCFIAPFQAVGDLDTG
jgi:hypothetical protein